MNKLKYITKQNHEQKKQRESVLNLLSLITSG